MLSSTSQNLAVDWQLSRPGAKAVLGLISTRCIWKIFSFQALADLKKRIDLDLERLSPPLEESYFHYGFNTEYLRQLAPYWRDKYDWRAREKMINSFPQFKTRIDGLDIHFLHVKPDEKAAKGKKVLPLLIVHGWPGTVMKKFLRIQWPMNATANRFSLFSRILYVEARICLPGLAL